MWDKLQLLRKDYIDLRIQDSIDHEKFSMISIVYNSSKIEGCSLSEIDTRILLEKNITAQGKPLTDHLMVKDHYDAFLFLKSESEKKNKLTLNLIKETGARVMKNTGGIVRSMSGDFDTSKGDLRLAQVYVDRKYFPDFSKVPSMLNELIISTNGRIDSVSGIETVKLAADLHYNLVNIHPFGDGNGRVSRLMMNYIQLYHNEPLIKIFTEDRSEYIEALNNTEEKNDPEIFRDFICRQQIKFYESEVNKYKNKQGFNLQF
jgi:Fic family protein